MTNEEKSRDGMMWRTPAGKLVRQYGPPRLDRGVLKVQARHTGRGGTVILRLDRLADPAEDP